jgi:hypothetical protein
MKYEGLKSLNDFVSLIRDTPAIVDILSGIGEILIEEAHFFNDLSRDQVTIKSHPIPDVYLVIW